MSRFTITIAPGTDADGDHEAVGGVLSVDSPNDRFAVTEFTLVAVDNADLSDQRTLCWG